MREKVHILRISIDQVRKELAESAAERLGEDLVFMALEGFTGYNMRTNEEVIDEYHEMFADDYDEVLYFTADGKLIVGKEVI